jgi:hypothetical protein
MLMGLELKARVFASGKIFVRKAVVAYLSGVPFWWCPLGIVHYDITYKGFTYNDFTYNIVKCDIHVCF